MAIVLSLFFGALGGALKAQPIFSEIMASSGRGIDWIELYNPGDQSRDLSGYYLSDDPEDLTKWEFPKGAMIGPNNYLLVYGKGTGPAQKFESGNDALVASFRLKVDGESLALVAPDGKTLIDGWLSYPALAEGISYGRANQAIGKHGYFEKPTPGAANPERYRYNEIRVSFSEVSRMFVESLEVALRCAATDGEIRYTLDGSDPTQESKLYEGRIVLDRNTHLRARFFDSEEIPGPIEQASYYRVVSSLVGFESTVPIVIVDASRGDQLGFDEWSSGCLAVIDVDPETRKASITGPLQVESRCAFKKRGSSSASWPKFSLALEARKDWFWEHDRKILPLDFPSDEDWILSGRYQFDKSLIRNDLIYSLGNQLGYYAPRSQIVEVFVLWGNVVSYRGCYQGVYSLVEKIKKGKKRVNFGDAKDTAVELNRPKAIFKKDRLGPGDKGFEIDGMGRLAWVYPKEERVTAADSREIRNKLSALSRMLSEDDEELKKDLAIEEHLDVDSWITTFWLVALSKSADRFTASSYYSIREDGKVWAGPVWDFDRSLGVSQYPVTNPKFWFRGRKEVDEGWKQQMPLWWRGLLENPDFWQKCIDFWQANRTGVLSIENIEATIDQLSSSLIQETNHNLAASILRSPAERNFRRWIASKPRQSYEAELSHLKQWLRARLHWIDSQFLAMPQSSHESGQVKRGEVVTFSAAAEDGDVYYTLDQSDPRETGGRISSRALSGGEIVVDRTMMIVARTRRMRNGSIEWSAPVRRVYGLH